MRSKLRRLLTLLVPRAWRETVGDDVDREARDLGRGDGWVAMQTARAGLSLRRASLVETIATDIRHAMRSLARSPGFAATAVLTFALGIGANIAVFTVVDRVLFRPLPYTQADRLVHLHNATIGSSSPTPASALPALVTLSIRNESTCFVDVAYSGDASGDGSVLTFAEPGLSLRLPGVSYNFASVLGVRPVLGRDFTSDDARAKARMLLLTYEAWRSRFGGDATVVGRILRAGRDAYEVVGVMPRGFVVPSSASGPALDGMRLDPGLFATTPHPAMLGGAPIARLRPGISVTQAKAEVDLITARLGQRHAEWPFVSRPVTMQPLQIGLYSVYRPYAWLIAAAVGAVLSIASLNLTMLLLARGRSRERDTAIRTALGASRLRVVSVALIETTMVCLAATVLAIVTCRLAYTALLAVVPTGLLGAAVSPLDGRLIAMSAVAAAACAVLATAWPARQAFQLNVTAALQRDARTTAGRLRGGATLLAIESALGVVLVAGAATTVHNFAGLVMRDAGYAAADLFEVHIQHGYQRNAPKFPTARVEGALETLRAFPGVQMAAVTNRYVVGRTLATQDFWEARGLAGQVIGVSDGLFETLGTPVVTGRTLSRAEVAEAAPVVLINRAAARALWPTGSPAEALGQAIAMTGGDRTVIGVVEDIRPAPGRAAAPGLYIPVTAPEAEAGTGSSLTGFVRMSPGHAPDAVQLDMRLDERLSRNNLRVTPIADMTHPLLQRPKFQAILFGSIAGIGLFVAAIGMYGIAAFDASTRRTESGVRMALGATPRQIRRMVLSGVLAPVLAGAAAGLVATWWAAQFLQRFLFEVDARSPWMLVGVTAALMLAAIAAAWIPARRAAGADPAAVLRA